MDCRKAEGLILADHFDGELKGVSLQELERHLRICLSCRELRERAVNAEQAFRGGPLPFPSEKIWVAVQERIAAGGFPVWERPWERFLEAGGLFFGEPRRLAFSATFATVVIVCGLTLPGILSRPGSNESDGRLVEATLAGGGVFLSADEESWADSVEHFLL